MRTMPSVRWMIRRDLPEVIRVERAVGGRWTAEGLLSRLRSVKCIAMVAEVGDRIVGFVVYRLARGRIDVLRLTSIGGPEGESAESTLLARVRVKLTSDRRPYMTLPVGSGKRWPVRVAPEWATVAARVMCSDDEVPDLAILADVLDEAGCDDERLTACLRRGGAVAREVYLAVRPMLTGVAEGCAT